MALQLTAAPSRAGSGERPAVLVLPGGGYGRQADHEAEPVAEWLAGLGIHGFVLRYRVAPDRHPAPLEDAKQAMLQIRGGAHGLAVDPRRVGVLGFSAGGHLAATLSTAVATGSADLDVPSAVPDLTVLCYPVVSYTRAVHQGSVDNLLGGSPSADLLAELSAEQQVTAATPPAFVWHTADDAAVPVRQAQPVADGQAGADQWPALCAGWLDRAGWTVS